MSVPGPWITPAGQRTVFGSRVGAIGALEGEPADGITRNGNAPEFSGGDFTIASRVTPTSKGYVAGVLQVEPLVMGDTTPGDWGEDTPPGALGFEWEEPDNLATPGPSVIGPLAAHIGRVELVDNSTDARPELAWSVRAGWMPDGSIVEGAPTGVGGSTRLATGPGLTGPGQFPVQTVHSIPAGVGFEQVRVEDNWPGVTIPNSGTSGWVAFAVILDAVLPGAAALPRVTEAQAFIGNFRSGRTPYTATSRFRWIMPDPPTNRYGWGLVLA